MKNIAVVCEVMKNDFIKMSKNNKGNNLDYIFLEQQLHNTPDIMRKRLQGEIDKIDESYENIILGYGLCSNGVVGLISEKHEIIIPKVDDCISLFLGSRERYLEEFKKDPATYYLCKGWIEYGGDPYRGYLVWTGQEDKIPKEWINNKEMYGKRYDEAVARLLITELLKNYNRIVLINNNDIEEIHRNYAKDMVVFISELLDRQIVFTEMEGSSKFLEEIFNEKWDQNNFIKVEPGKKILQEYFFK
jgi:hypothetical protein